jgi:hypothetical protein
MISTHNGDKKKKKKRKVNRYSYIHAWQRLYDLRGPEMDVEKLYACQSPRHDEIVSRDIKVD